MNCINLPKNSLVFAVSISLTLSATYKDEFRDFERSSPEMNFPEDMNFGIKSFRRDLKNFPKMGYYERMLSVFDIVHVDTKSMPALCGYVDDICQENDIAVPSVFIVTNKNFFNALATKLLSSGSIVVGKKMIEKVSDDELEGVLAHELGHIKYNHTAKKLALYGATYALARFLTETFMTDEQIKKILPPSILKYVASPAKIRATLIGTAAALLPNLIINKRFEREADEFAYKIAGKGEGLCQYFKHRKQMDEITEQQFSENYLMLQDPNNHLDTLDKIYFTWRLFSEKILFYLNRWLYYNTFLGDHPSPEDRIKAIEKHLAKQ